MSSTQTEGKVVQTELSAAEYRHFQLIAEDQGLSLKEALRRAAREYVERNESYDPDDPLLTFHDRVDAPDGEQTTPDGTDDDLYGES